MPAPANEITHIMPASAGRIKYCQLGMPALAGSVPLMIWSEKTFPRYMYLDGLGNFWWFLSKNIFLPLLNKFWAKKSLFGGFLKNTIF